MSEHEDKPVAAKNPPRRRRAASAAGCALLPAPSSPRRCEHRGPSHGFGHQPVFVASSSAFENAVRRRLITSLERNDRRPGEIASFHWRLLHFEAEADGVVIHGLEDPGEAPYAKNRSPARGFQLAQSFQSTFACAAWRLTGPACTSSSIPTDRRISHSRASGTPRQIQWLTLCSQCNAGHITVEQGSLDYDCRNASFDFQNRNAPLDFSANDASLVHALCPATFRTAASYRIEVGVTDLNLARTVPRSRCRCTGPTGHARSGARACVSAFPAHHGGAARRPESLS